MPVIAGIPHQMSPQEARWHRPRSTPPAPNAAGPVHGIVRVPGSKSLTNRYLVLAALAEGPSTLDGVLDSRDSRLMIQALSDLGATFTPRADGSLHVSPLTPGARLEAEEVRVDCGLAGTVMRFVPPIAALLSGTVHFDGDPPARRRPLGPVLDALDGLGVGLTGPGRETGTLPVSVHGTGTVSGGRVEIDAGASSQFVSALLLAGPRFSDGVHLVHTGSTVPSPEHIGMTVQVLRRAGVQVDDSRPGQWRVAPGPIAALDTSVEPDLSNAGPFLAAAVATGGQVSIPDWPLDTTQIGDRWRTILPAFGADVELTAGDDGRTGTLRVRGQLDASGHPRLTAPGEIADTGELAPTVAALCLLAEGPGRLTGIGQLRGHETDRLAAVAAEAERLGGRADEAPDGLEFTPAPLHGAVLETYEDHRLATFAAVVGLAVPGVLVRDVATTAKTMPDFPRLWTELVTGPAVGA